MKRAKRFFFFLAILLALGLVALAMRPRHRTRAGGSAASGGVASSDAGGLVEDGRHYAARTWSFAMDRYELRIEDTGFTTALDAILEKKSAELVVNGGFFDPDGKAVGLAVSKGALLSRLSQKMSGGVLAFDGNRLELFAAESFVMPDSGSLPFAVQCKPRLVVDGVANVKSDDGKRAERTALCVRDGGKTLEVIVVRGSDDGESAGPSLFALANHLVASGCEAALNLDGGPSTGAAWREGGASHLFAPRAPVRHAIVVIPR